MKDVGIPWKMYPITNIMIVLSDINDVILMYM